MLVLVTLLSLFKVWVIVGLFLLVRLMLMLVFEEPIFVRVRLWC